MGSNMRALVHRHSPIISPTTVGGSATMKSTFRKEHGIQEPSDLNLRFEMRKRNSVLILFSAITISSFGQEPGGTKPDNTKVNQGDRNPGQVTADQQKENATDRELSARVRQSIVADKSLSSYAHNIKIISQNGTVTLKGPVKSEAEKQTVIAKAVAITGSANKVHDQISISGKK